MWDGRKGASWNKFTQLKEDGGLGICDFMLIDEAATIKEVTTLWEGTGSIWNYWMNNRYVKVRAL